MGADINFADFSGATPLHQAVGWSSTHNDTSFDMERFLLENGAKINATDKNLRTPLHYAFVRENQLYPSSKETDPVETVTSLLGIPECDHTVRGSLIIFQNLHLTEFFSSR